MEYLVHHGIKGMHWGVRRYQNKDGTLTAEGKEKYGSKENYEKVKEKRKQTIKKVAIGAAVAAAILGTGIAAYKINQSKKEEKIDIQKLADQLSSNSHDEPRLKRFAQQEINNPINQKAVSFTKKMTLGEKAVTVMKKDRKITVDYDGTDFRKIKEDTKKVSKIASDIDNITSELLRKNNDMLSRNAGR